MRQTFDHCESITALTDDTYYRMSHPSWGETDSLAYCDSITDLTDDTSYRMSHPSKSETDCFGHLFHYKQMTLPAECPILQGCEHTDCVAGSLLCVPVSLCLVQGCFRVRRLGLEVRLGLGTHEQGDT